MARKKSLNDTIFFVSRRAEKHNRPTMLRVSLREASLALLNKRLARFASLTRRKAHCVRSADAGSFARDYSLALPACYARDVLHPSSYKASLLHKRMPLKKHKRIAHGNNAVVKKHKGERTPPLTKSSPIRYHHHHAHRPPRNLAPHPAAPRLRQARRANSTAQCPTKKTTPTANPRTLRHRRLLHILEPHNNLANHPHPRQPTRMAKQSGRTHGNLN